MKGDTSMSGPKVKKWTAREFHHTFSATELYRQRPFLIRGIVWEHGPQSPSHAAVRGIAAEVLRPFCGEAFHVRQRNPLVLTDDTDLVPDVAVVTGGLWTYLHAHPRTAALVMEISDNELHEDLSLKMELNAEYGIPEYWVLDVLGWRLFMFRTPMFAPDAVIPVSEFLP